MTDWKLLGREQSSSVRGTIPTFLWKVWEKNSKKFGWSSRCSDRDSNLTCSNY